MKEKPSKIEDLFKPPAMSVDVCAFCASPVEPKLDRKGHPFVHCGFCNSITFLRSDHSRIGYEIIAQIVKKNLRQHKKLLEERYRKHVQMKKSPLSR